MAGIIADGGGGLGMGNREWSLPVKMVGRIMDVIYKLLDGYRPYNTPQEGVLRNESV